MGLLRKIVTGPSRKTVAALSLVMAAGCFFFTWLNGHTILMTLQGIIVGILFAAGGIALIVKERRGGRWVKVV